MIRMIHLTQETMEALKGGRLSEEETISALTHLGECERCAVIFAESYQEDELLELPTGFRASVLAAAEEEDAEKKRAVVQLGTRRERKRRELFRYSFRVGIAACITLFLLFSGTINYGINFSRSIHTNSAGVDTITEKLRTFSDRMVDFEVGKYLKEEF